MKIVSFDNWASLAQSSVAAPGCIVGVAIAPESDEGLVRVNDELLQSGRILPMAGSSFTVKRVNGTTAGELPSIKRLRLMLFEHRDEFTIDPARPDGRYNNGGIPSFTVDSAYHEALVVPFTGREQLSVQIRMLQDLSGAVYRVRGRRWSTAQAAVRETILVTDQAYSVTTGGDSVAFYVGGIDNAECWDELAIDVKATAGTGTVAIDARTIGEIGIGG